MFSSVLSEDQIRRIDESSLALLERVGVVVPHPELLARFADSGANVDHESSRVRIPPDLVKKLLGQAGKRFTIYGRDTARKAEFGSGKRSYNSTAGQASWLEDLGGQRRWSTLEDVATAARFCDALDSINIAGAMADPHEIDVRYRCVEVMAAMLRNTTKPMQFWFHDRASARYLVEMLVAIRGDERGAEQFPVCWPFLEPISPLRFPFHGIDVLFETTRLNIPAFIGPMAQMGLSAPGTVAGTMVQENAELLAGVCVTQLVRPGLPICYGGICHAFDMRTTQMIFSGPEQAIFVVAMTQMGKHYGLPVYVNAGLTDSKTADAQAGIESAITLTLAAAAGADIFGHFGTSGVDQASSLDILVLHDEMIGYVESTMREIDFSDEAIGLAEVEAVGPGGTFIDREHTAAHFRKELWFPRLLDRSYYQQWLDSGAPDTAERCRARKEEILRTHQPEPMPEHVDREISRIVEAARGSADIS